MLSRMKAPLRALGLAPVSVTPDRQRSGIGSLLIRTALERATREGWNAVIVLGDPAYYTRFGFDAALASGFESPYAGPYLMALPLKGSLAVTSGRIDYAAAFAALEGH
jgi:putative acetyltransferase